MELSVKEINRKVIGNDSLKSRNLPFRYIPKEIVSTAKEHLNKTGDVEKVLRYIENSFYIYRECVNRNMFAPHYDVDDAYEWPKPVKFSWSSIDSVILGGEYVYRRIPSIDNKIRIETPVTGGIEVKEIDTKTGFVKDSIRDIIPGKDDLNKTLKYNIESLNKIGVIFSDWWQNASLKDYANPIYFLLTDLLNGKPKKMLGIA